MKIERAERLKHMRAQGRTESFVIPSRDGRFIIHRTVITTVWPASYMKRVLKEARQGAIGDLGKPGALDKVLEKALGGERGSVSSEM